MNALHTRPERRPSCVLDRLALAPDRIVQELGYDDDVNSRLPGGGGRRPGAPMEDGAPARSMRPCCGGAAVTEDLTDALAVDPVGLLDDGGYVAC